MYWNPIVANYTDEEFWRLKESVVPTSQQAKVILRKLNLPVVSDCLEEHVSLIHTTGKWFQLPLLGATMGEMSKLHERPHNNLKIAYHASALTNLVLIPRQGLQRGPSCTGGNIAVFCEGQKRLTNVSTYMTHRAFPESASPLLQWSCVFERLADRNVGGSVHDQWA